MQLTVNVTAAHITAGIVHDCTKCPIALAIRDALRGTLADFVHAGIREIRIGVIDLSVECVDAIFPTPDSAAGFMGKFDRLRPVQPFTFTLDLPDHGPWAIPA